MEFFEQAQGWTAATNSSELALITVVNTQGSVPRHVGARMLVNSSGEQCQTIGGGRVEAEVISLAEKVASGSAPSAVVTHHLVRDLAMCCGGSMTFLIERVDDAAIFDEVLLTLEARNPVLLSQSASSPLSIRQSSESRAPSWSGEVFVQSLWPKERAIVFGAGHVCQALAPLLRSIDFRVVVCDDNELGALEAIEPTVDEAIASFELSDVERSLGALGIADYALVLTRDHAIDQRLVEKLLTREAVGYVGLIGSRGKVGRFKRRILAKGEIGESEWQRLHSPVGIDIAAETPAEIAVAICAQLIQIRSSRRGGGE